MTPKTVATIIFFFLITVYAFYQTHALAEGPEIILLEPTTPDSVTDPVVVISGIAERISHLFLNGRQIFTDKEGHFNEKLLLAPGFNSISLDARDRFDRVIAKKIEVFYESVKSD